MTNDCPICLKPIADTGYVCHRCAEHLRDDLRNLAVMHRELDVTLTRQARIDDPGRSSSQPLVFGYTASEAAFVIRNTLTTWTRHIESERGTRLPDQERHRPSGPTCRVCKHPTCVTIRLSAAPDASIESRCALWLSTQVDWIRHRPEAEQIASELMHCWVLLRHTIDRPGRQVFCGPCDLCNEPMYARPGAPQVQCRKGCEGTYDVTARREWLLEQADDQIAHAGLIARAVTDLGEPIKPGRIRLWAHRGRLLARGTDHAGRPLYAVRDVRRLLRQDAERDTRKGA